MAVQNRLLTRYIDSSWKTVLLQLLNIEEGHAAEGNVIDFLKTSESQQILKNPLRPFSPVSSQTTSDFNAKTASVSADSQKCANIAEIKADALWLGKKCDINELSALRIVIIEWQNRPASQLLSNFSAEEITSLQDAVGIGGATPVTSHAGIANVLRKHRGDLNPRPAGLSEEDNRHLMIWLTYLSERQNILSAARRLLCTALKFVAPGCVRGDPVVIRLPNPTPLESLAQSTYNVNDELREITLEKVISIQDCVDAVAKRMQSLPSGSQFFSDKVDLDIENAWITYHLEELLQIMQIMYLAAQTTHDLVPETTVLAWLRLMRDYNYLEGLCPATTQQVVLCSPIRALVVLVTCSILKSTLVDAGFSTIPVDETLDIPDIWKTKTPFFLSRDAVEIHQIMSEAAAAGIKSAAPAILSWTGTLSTTFEYASLASRRRAHAQVTDAIHAFKESESAPASEAATVVGEETTVFEKLFERLGNPDLDSGMVQGLLAAALDDCHAAEVMGQTIETLESICGPNGDRLLSCWARVELLMLIKSFAPELDYSPELLSATLIAAAMPDESPRIACRPRGLLATDDSLRTLFVRAARNRFPYEAVNFLKVCRVIVGYGTLGEDGLSFAAQEIVHLNTYTHQIPDGFVGYRTVREEENANYVKLRRPLHLVDAPPPSAAPVDAVASTTTSTFIPARTLGRVVGNVGSPVVTWNHQYNGFSFLGSCLEEAANGNSIDGLIDQNTMAEIIGLFADLLEEASSNKTERGRAVAGAKTILEMASDELRRYGDIVSLVLDIFERNLQDIKHSASSRENLALSTSCVQFITSLLKILPGRVWPFLARSGLLGLNGKGGILAHIVTVVEVSSGEYSFLISAVNLFEALINDALTLSAIRRLNPTVISNAKYTSDFTAAVPPHVMRQILYTNVRVMVEIYNVNTTWTFVDLAQQAQINSVLAECFERILHAVYAIDDRDDLNTKITGVFSTSAQYIVNALKPSQNEGFPLNPILTSLFSALESPITSSCVASLTLRARQTHATLKLSEKLVQVGKYMNAPISPLETQLFKSVPLLIRLYIAIYEYRLPVTRLLSLLVSHASADHSTEPPSLFGSLGSETTCKFLDCLSRFDRPVGDPILRSKIWSFLSEIISSRQQWIAVFLLTGASPRNGLSGANKEKETGPSLRGKAFMTSALDILVDIENGPQTTILSALEFIATAQEHWPWVTPELARKNDFFPKILKYVSSIDLQNPDIYKRCIDIKIAAAVADICSMYIYSAKEARDLDFFKTLRPAISWYSENAIAVNGYNASLHSNLKKNFEMKFSGFNLSDIKKTVLESSSLNEPMFYDTALGTEFFGYEFAWSHSKGNFVEELERANLNLFLVESQKVLLQSFKFLAIEHCASFVRDREIQRSMARVVHQCLVSNSATSFTEEIFASLHQSRADFALALLHRLVEVKTRGSEVFQLLDVAWNTIKARHSSYEGALANDDKTYYTTLIEILYLTLQFHTEGAKRGSPEGVSKRTDISSDLPTVVDIVKVLIVDGFRILTTHLHEQPQDCQPRDFALLNAVFETVLQVQGIDRMLGQIARILLDGEMPRYALTLFSWATKFTINNDPIYGELSLLLLLQMSCIPMVAEQLAVDHIFLKLSTCHLIKVLSSPSGCGPFDVVPRLYSIWSGGILPLCLSILFHTNGAAPEIVNFLNQFDAQLNRAGDSLAISKSGLLSSGSDESTSMSERISLSMVSEVAHLALLTQIIRRLKLAGAAIGLDPTTLNDLKWDKAQVKMDVESLLEKRSLLKSRIAPADEKELRMLRRSPTNTDSDCDNELEERIVKELRNALLCLDEGEGLTN